MAELNCVVRSILAYALIVLVLCPSTAQADPASNAPRAGDTTYEAHVRPILEVHCFRCHGADQHKADLDLSSRQGISKGGESGEIVAAGKPDESLLFRMVHEGEMPPEDKDPLSEAEIDAIGRWIAGGARFADPAAADQPLTQHDVIPIMLLRCTVCHGLRKREAGLDLRSKAGMLAGGKSGPAIVPGKPEESLILQKINGGEMPPRRRVVEVSIKPMEPAEIEVLARWIAQGAPEAADPVAAADDAVTDADRQFWSFQRPRAAAPPAVAGRDRVRNPIDAFVLQRLESAGLSLSPEAGRLTLLRRATFDLTGLPPTPDEVAAFVSDPDPLVYERLIDRLLASPRYGERWARFWLDLAGYSDSEGVQNSDPVRPNAWRYRDYVIRALNGDKPYDRFLQEQIAGDELADYEHAEEITPELYDNLAATGFLRMAPDGTFSAITAFVPDRLDVVNAEMEVLSTSVLGLTLRCARCHSHKFDPIPQRDYYRLLAVFKGAYDEHDWLKPTAGGQGSLGHFDVRELPFVTTAERREWEAREQQLGAAIAALQGALDQKTQELSAKLFEERLAALPEVLRDDLRKMLAMPADQRDAVQKYLAEKFEASLRVGRADIEQADAEFKKFAEETARRIGELEAQRTPLPTVRALWDRGEPSPQYVLRRGNYLTPGAAVEPGVPTVLGDAGAPFVVEPPWPGAKQTGRRLALARWLTRPEHPLTARVLVNRVWKHHFGAGLVKTLDNFGKTGARPTHPELLDWLAVEFLRGGWSVKRLHRLIMTSATYRQSSQVQSDHERLDPDGALLSRMPLRRLEGEALRDSLLSAAGRLDGTPFGPPDPVDVAADGLVTPRGTAAGWRRSIYILQRRSEVPTILETFDLPRMTPNCVERQDSNVAPQALHLMNNRLVRELSDDFARRLAEAGERPEQQIERAYLVALGRPPTDEERQLSLSALAELTEEWRAKLASQPAGTVVPDDISRRAAERALGSLCHALLNSAEFIYID